MYNVKIIKIFEILLINHPFLEMILLLLLFVIFLSISNLLLYELLNPDSNCNREFDCPKSRCFISFTFATLYLISYLGSPIPSPRIS